MNIFELMHSVFNAQHSREWCIVHFCYKLRDLHAWTYYMCVDCAQTEKPIETILVSWKACFVLYPLSTPLPYCLPPSPLIWGLRRPPHGCEHFVKCIF
jgi:hypothetical protein